MPAGRQVRPLQQSYETLQLRPDWPQHLPDLVLAFFSQLRFAPHDTQASPRGPQELASSEAKLTQVPMGVQQPSQLSALHRGLHWLCWQLVPTFSVQSWQSTPPRPHCLSVVGATMQTLSALQQPSLQFSRLHS